MTGNWRINTITKEIHLNTEYTINSKLEIQFLEETSTEQKTLHFISSWDIWNHWHHPNDLKPYSGNSEFSKNQTSIQEEHSENGEKL